MGYRQRGPVWLDGMGDLEQDYMYTAIAIGPSIARLPEKATCPMTTS